MAYAGLETLFQNMGPTYAASMAGEREGTALGLDQLTARKEQEAILKAQEENRQAKLMNPGLLEQQGLGTEKLRLGNAGQALTNTAQAQTNDYTAATQGSKIKTQLSADELKQMGDQVTSLKLMREKATQMVAGIMSAGPAAEAQKMQLVQSGMLPPQIAEMVARTPVQNLPAIMAKANAWINQQDEKYQQAEMVAKMQKDSHLAGISMQNKTQKDLEQMRIDAGKYDKKGSLSIAVDDRLYKAKTPIEKAEILESAYHAAQDNGDNESAAKYAVRALEARKRAAEDAQNRGLGKPAADLGALGITPTAPPAANAPIAGNKTSLPAGWTMK